MQPHGPVSPPGEGACALVIPAVSSLTGASVRAMLAAEFTAEVDEDTLRREKRKARELRQSQWWKNRRAQGICYYCRRRFPARELTMDHIIPIIRGGKSVKSNVVPCCKSCNSKKQYLLPVEWEEYLQSLSSRRADS